ncbi:MAG: hypothetical protein PWP04_1211 [Candidatus Atribacteria bacterium]|nr:hypothetical protein [Candidatus Atribacteria bacterium]
MIGNPLFEVVLQKLKEVGARPSASEKERTFLEFLRGTLLSLNLTTEWETFPALSTYTWPYLLLWGGFIQAALLLRWMPLWSFVTSLVLLFLEYWELSTFPFLSSLFHRRSSHNLIGKSGSVPKIVLLAHVDSATPSIFFHPRFVTNPRLSLMLVIFSSSIITALAGLRLFVPHPVWQWVALFPSFYLLLITAGHVHREFFMTPSPGGNDNGSGVAVALELARLFKEKGFPFWVVFTGAEESGTWGALHLAKKHKNVLRSVPIINFDNLGIGRLTLATREGMWKIYNADATLLRALEKASDDSFILRPYLGLSTDATPLLARGFKVVTIIALGDKGLPVNWHWHTDTVDAIDKKNLEKAVEFLSRFMEERSNESPAKC